jgi:cytochrome c biogenesis protein CcmG, thiol:disulfide interchange protein DsbE
MSPVATLGHSRGWRQRIRESRLGTLLVLALTAAIVMWGAYLVDRPAAAAPGVSAVALKDSGGAAPQIGSPAPDFTATTIAGRRVSLSSYKGHPVWLTFGASWCSACQAEAPDIEAAYQKFKAQGVVVLAISIAEDAATDRDWSNRVGLTFPMIADPNSDISSAYRVSSIPAHFFIDASGVLRSIKAGGLSPDQMDAAITSIGG